jgi:NTE family protein
MSPRTLRPPAGRKPAARPAASRKAADVGKRTPGKAAAGAGARPAVATKPAPVRAPGRKPKPRALAAARPAHAEVSLQQRLAAYGEVALVLQGGGALGAYQAGVVQGLDEAGIQPTWVAGISIGAIHCALIAGNPPQRRAARLREFWDRVTRPPLLPATPWEQDPWLSLLPPESLRWLAPLQSLRALTEGQRGFFVPRPLPGQGPDQASMYDTAPLRATLEELVDFDLLNSGAVRVSVGAVNVRTGNFEYFDNTRQRLGPEHFMASGALPPGFAAARIGDEYYWDGGLVSNTPLTQVLGGHPKAHTLVFQVDLWSAQGQLPRSLLDVAGRVKDIQYSSRTRAVTDLLQQAHTQRKILRGLLERVPPGLRAADDLCREVEAMARDMRYNVIQLIYRDKPYDGQDKDYQFGRASMRAHWDSGMQAVQRTLQHARWLDLPSAEQPFVTHDMHRVADE